MIANMPKVSIIIPAFNEEKYIKNCLISLLQQTYQNVVEILIVDGFSSDQTRNIITELSSKYGKIKLLDNHKKITAAALNIAIKQVVGDIIVRADAHAVFDQFYVERCVFRLLETGADNVGGPMYLKSETKFQKAVEIAFSSMFGVGGAKFHLSTEPTYADTVWLGAFNKEIFGKVGFYDERLIGSEDDELNYRIIANGGNIFLDPNIKGFYFPRDSFQGLFRQFWNYGCGKVKTMCKHSRPTNIRQLIPPILVSSLLVLLVLSFFFSIAGVGFLALSLFYLLCAIIFSLYGSYQKGKTRLFLVVFTIFIGMHFGYGLGYLRELSRMTKNKIYD